MSGGEGSKVLRVVLIVLAVLGGTAAVCCTGMWFAGERVADEVQKAVGPVVEGSGVAAVQERLVDDFQAIDVDGVIDVEVQIGETTSVTLQSDDNILPVLTTTVVDGTLFFSSRQTYDAKTDVRATVTVPALRAVTIDGFGDLVVRGLDESVFKIAVRGVGSVTIDGSVDALDVEVTGTGDAHLARLVARTARVLVSGHGDAEVNVTEKLEASVKGPGDVVYHGSPADVQRDVEGMGDVLPAK